MTIEIELLGDDHKMAQFKPPTYVVHNLTQIQLNTLERLKIPQVLWPTCTRQAQVLINDTIAVRAAQLCVLKKKFRVQGITHVPLTWEEADDMDVQLMRAKGLLHLFFEGHGISTIAVQAMIDKQLHPAIIRRILMVMNEGNNSWSTWIDVLGALSNMGSELDSNLVQSAYQFVVDEHDVMMHVQAQMELDAMIAQCVQEEEDARCAREKKDALYARSLVNSM